jgi:Fuc2NAc and GlcNAc transferase
VTVPSTSVVFAVAAAAGLAAWWMTGRFRDYALANRILDLPNARSSHSAPTPRGGGVAIVAATLLALVALAAAGAVDAPLVWALMGAGLLVAAVGYVDDRSDLAEHWRLGGHFLAAAWVLFWLGGLPPLPVFDAPVSLGWTGVVLAVVYLAWLVNLTNFMDGIDGIAATEAAIVSTVAAALAAVAAPGTGSWPAPLALAAAAAGFLVWNWPPARIFMGDAGSGFLGIGLGALSLHAAWSEPRLLWSWWILLAVFTTDTTITLLTRAVTRVPRFWKAHRSHAYQCAVAQVGSHRFVTLSVAAINLLWLPPHCRSGRLAPRRRQPFPRDRLTRRPAYARKASVAPAGADSNRDAAITSPAASH